MNGLLWRPSTRSAVGVVLAMIMIVVLSPVSASAYVENEYVKEMGTEQNEKAIALEKEREAAAAASASRKAEEEHAAIAAQEQRVQEEREAREQAERVQREATEREEEAREAHEARANECVVPNVIDDTLPAAVKTLRKAHCALGSVSRSRSYRGRLVVLKESRRVGVRFPEGTAISLKIGHRKSDS
jgi:hypothetical protein